MGRTILAGLGLAWTLVAGAETLGACRPEWRVAGVSSHAVRCRDGDPACDVDARADGACTLSVALCAEPSGCASTGVVTVRSSRSAPVESSLLDPGGLAAGARCAETVALRVALDGRKRRQMRLRATVAGVGRRRSARLRLRCLRARTAAGRALVATSDFETGLLATVRIGRPRRVRRLPGRIHADAVVRVSAGRVFVVNRLGGDNVQVLDPDRLATRLQCSTGTRSNPFDVAVVAPDRAYVTRYGAADLWIVDPTAASCAGFRRGRIDLGGLADADGLPEMAQIAIVGDRAFVSLQRLDRRSEFAPTRAGALAVIDTGTDTLVDVVDLAGTNPFGDASGLPREPGSGNLLVNLAGDTRRVGDGGLQRVDPVTLVAEPSLVVTEDALGGTITDFVVVGPTKGYAIVFAPSPPRNLLVTFDPTTGERTGRLLTRTALLPDLALAPDGRLWLADQSLPAPGIRIFDVATDRPVRRGVIDVGLPPFSMGFLP